MEHTILPAFRTGTMVVCDRYVPTSLVLQRLDGVDPEFLTQLNRYAAKPDLTVVLTGEPERSAQRASDRGIYSRFHYGGAATRAVEDRLYRDLVRQLRETDSDVLHHEVTDEPAEAVAAVVLGAVLQRWEQRSG
ncbi:dTMP kinase [Micromonospora sp. LOL_014]|uniref:dTMP kinase n=1 Tax=Micromonospora sp. LOL_014 TaxID=3345415 RepID=UPI003A8941D8